MVFNVSSCQRLNQFKMRRITRTYNDRARMAGLEPEELKAIEIMEYISWTIGKPKVFEKNGLEVARQITFIITSD